MLYGNGGSGQFSQVLVNPSSRSGEFALLYSEQGLFLTVPHGVTHEDQGCTCAQRCLLAIVDDLEETSRGGPLRWLSDEVLRQFPLFPDCCLYQQFVGEPYTDLLPMALYAGRMTTHAVQKQLWRAHDVWLQPRPATHAWVDGWGEQWHQSRGSDPLIAGWRAYGLSFDFGVDAQPSSNSLVGIAGSWVRTRGAVETNRSQLETNMAGANLYGSIWARESLYLDLQFGWSHLRSKLTRHIDVPRLRDQLVAEPHGVRRSARAELGVIDRLTRGLGVQLFSAFEGAWVNLSTWAENSSSAAALVGSKAWSKALWLEQGARLFSTSCLGAWNFQPELTLTSVYNFYQDPYALSVSWLHAADLPTSGCRFCPVEGLTPVAWFGALAPGLIAQRGPLQLAARLNVEAAPRWWSWGGNLQLSYGF